MIIILKPRDKGPGIPIVWVNRDDSMFFIAALIKRSVKNIPYKSLCVDELRWYASLNGRRK